MTEFGSVAPSPRQKWQNVELQCSNVRELLANLRTTQALFGFLVNMLVDRDNMGAVQALGGIILTNQIVFLVAPTIPEFML